MTTGVTGTGTGTGTGTSAATQQLTGNFDTFLQLLTTQLQNQDPLNPMDSNQFTQQLVEFSQVEQQINTNSNLQSLISLTEGNAGSAAVGYLGKDVTISNGNAALTNGTATWNYTLGADSSTTQLSVTNSAGQVVYTGSGETSSGSNTFTWDGQDNNGNQLPDGTYTLAVTATGSDGSAIQTSVSSSGIVSEVAFQNGVPVLMIGSMTVPLSQVSSIGGPTS
jgi:flagellar basal-body rod modification protein FlgD